MGFAREEGEIRRRSISIDIDYTGRLDLRLCLYFLAYRAYLLQYSK